MIHAGCCAGVAQHLRAVAATGVDVARANGAATIAQVKRTDASGPLFGPGRTRENGHKLHYVHLFRVETPAASRSPWDLYDLVSAIPAERAFRRSRTETAR